MHSNAADVVRVSLKRCHTIQGIVVENPNLDYNYYIKIQIFIDKKSEIYLHVIRASNHPIFPRNKLSSTDRKITHLQKNAQPNLAMHQLGIKID